MDIDAIKNTRGGGREENLEGKIETEFNLGTS